MTAKRYPLREMPKRIVLDLSDTYISPHQTGIQRVVRNLHRELAKAAKVSEIDFVAVVCKDGKFLRLDSLAETTVKPRWLDVDKIRSDVSAHCPKIYRKLCAALCTRTGSKKLKRWLLPEPGHRGIFKLPLRILEAVSRWRYPAKTPQSVSFAAGDLLILPDGYWGMMHVWPAVAAAREVGTKVAVVVYDLICITHPQFFVPLAEEHFTKYLCAINEHTDVVTAISNTVKLQLDAKLPALAAPHSATPYRCSFRLGAEFSQAKGTVRAGLKETLSDKDSSFYLMVSTFEPRKNHRFVLDTFERFWETHPDCKLVLVGAVGWMTEALLARIRQHPELNRKLFVYHDLSDAEVSYCYARSKAVIFPSVVEGFGLPIVEALWHGKKTFASDTAIHREVGRDDCEYFHLEDADSLRRLLVRWEAEDDQAPNCLRKPITWEQSAQDLLSQILTGLAQSEAPLRRSA
jgi:alpha-1,2-rhamnosyltransferase